MASLLPLQSGELFHIISKKNLLKRRWYYLTADEQHIVYGSKKRDLEATRMSLGQLLTVTSGCVAAGFAAFFAAHPEEKSKTDGTRCFSLLFATSTVHFIAKDTATRDTWVQALGLLRAGSSPAAAAAAATARAVSTDGGRLLFINEQDRFLIRTWQLATHQRKGTRNSIGKRKLMKVIMRDIGVLLPEAQVSALFDEFDTDRSGALDFQEYCNLLYRFRHLQPIDEIFAQAKQQQPQQQQQGSRPTITSPARAKAEMHLEQNEFVSLIGRLNGDDATVLAQHFQTYSQGDAKMTLFEFEDFLLSTDNQCFAPEKEAAVYMDMTHPLPHYFINSSHNTYLSQDQLTGPSSVLMYSYALNLGCRCVELDCWDGLDGEPIIYHGHTLTSKITFADVCQTIATHAFRASSYPVILSIENHCSIQQQHRLAEIMIEKFGAHLADSPFGDPAVEQLQSPAQLQYKIIVKGKCNAKKSSSSHGGIPHLSSSSALGDDEEDFDEEGLSPQELFKLSRQRKGEGTTSVLSTSNLNALSSSASLPVSNASLPSAQEKRHHPVTTDELLSSITTLNGVTFKGFAAALDPAKKINPCNMSSFTEGKAEKLIARESAEWVRYNIGQMSRIYPAGKRVDSSNYSPLAMWSAGCQLVALNFQTPSLPMFFNQGKFRDNGGCGYLLKPEYMLDRTRPFDATAPSSAPTNSFVLSITVLGARQLFVKTNMEGDIPDPYVVLTVGGVPADAACLRTVTVQNNALNPVWNETFSFTIRNGDLALLCLEIFDENVTRPTELLCYATIPVRAIRTGIRSVKLFSPRHQLETYSRLLVHVRKTAISSSSGSLTSSSSSSQSQ